MAKKQTVPQKAVRQKLRRHVKLAVVPHAANQHRPHLVRRYGIALILALVLVSQGFYNAVISGNVLGVQADLTSKTLLDSTNSARADQGVAPLALNPKLSQAAELKINDMFDQQYWAHVAPDGTTPWRWFEQAEYRYAEAGENLAKNFSTSNGVVSAWMISPTHRANVLKETYQDVGFAVKTGELEGKTTTIVVAMYGTSDAAMVQGVADTEAPGTGVSFSPIAQLGLTLKSLNPVAIASLVLLLLAANVALIAHSYRDKLPVKLRKGWYRHHGAYKAVFFVLAATVLLVAYSTSTGQI